MMNLLKVAIVAAGGGKAVAARFKVHPASVSRWIAGTNPFPPEHVAELCAMGDGIVKVEQLTQFLADRAAAQARGRVLERAAA